MKKYLLLILCTLFISVSLSAQSKSNQHLKFMGIPINGSITNFQNKLIAKGLSYNKAISKAIESPVRIFNGQFAGEKADIFVYYNRSLNLVYSVGVVIERSTEDEVVDLMSHFISSYEAKYGIEAEDNDDSYDFNVDNGLIRLSYNGDYYDGYNFYILYIDNINYEKHDANNMDDL